METMITGSNSDSGNAVSWLFCSQCGTILSPPVGNSDVVVCGRCKYKCSFTEMNKLEVITVSASKPKPHWIEDEEGNNDDQLGKHATIEEPCPKCGNPELLFYTMQLRSVDEGSTVFYECPVCAHKFSQNN